MILTWDRMIKEVNNFTCCELIVYFLGNDVYRVKSFSCLFVFLCGMGRGGPTYKSVSVLSTHIALLKLRSYTIDCSSCKIREIIKSHCQHLDYISALSSIKKETFEQTLLCQWLGHSKHSVAFQNDLNLLHCTISKLVPLCTFYQFLDLFIGSYIGRLCQGSRDWSIMSYYVSWK